MASPTVLMLASSSSGMATPNLSSTAVAISTIDSESTSRSSVNDFSGVASAGATPATSSRISATPAWMSSLTRGSSLSVVAGGARRRSRWSGGLWGSSGERDDLAGEGQPRAVAEEEGEVAAPGLAGLHQRGQRQRDRRRGGVGGPGDVAGGGGGRAG